jgi:hypothetical protein
VISRSMRRRIVIARRNLLSWRPTGLNLAELLRTIVTSFIALGVTFVILPGDQSAGPVSVLLLVVTVVGVGFVLRPLLLGLAVLLGSFSLLIVGVLAQAIILGVALSIAPDVQVSSYPRIVGVSWIAAAIAAVVNWLLDSGSQDAYLAQVLGRVVRIAHRHAGEPEAGTGEPGLLIVQLDGVGQALMRQAIVAGAVPTVARWLRSGDYHGYRWHTGLPATTPAGQSVLLHGDRKAVPSFRWFEKDSGRLMVANRPADAHEIEQRLSTGRGLLADGGVSVSNLFSGDAPTRILTMSDARLPSRSTRGLASFATTSLGFIRTLVVFLGQVVVEMYQARRQRRRDVRPRVARGGVFALLRGVTTAFLHDLNVTIVAEQMARGAPVIFVDFVDYDEIAHHAGPSRPESVRTLDALDRVLRFFEDVAAETNRRYEIVVVSDHGQSQGAPFDQLAGQSLEALVAELSVDAAEPAPPAARAALADDQAERFGPINVLLTSAARSRGAGIGSFARRKANRAGRDGARTPLARDEMQVSLGHTGTAAAGTGAGADDATPLVAAAGSLAHIYLPAIDGRATREQIDERHPELVAGLAAHPAIGLVLVRGIDRGPIVIGAGGWRALAATGSDFGEGDDPLDPFGPVAARDLLDLDGRDHVGDIVVLGRFDPETGEVAAFEELVGSHGGLGGDQTAALLLVPSTWPAITGTFRASADDDVPRLMLDGVQVHNALLERLRFMGLRPGDLPAPTSVELDSVPAP